MYEIEQKERNECKQKESDDNIRKTRRINNKKQNENSGFKTLS